MMNNDEIERKMNFIVEQQAQFASDIQQLQESQARTDQVVAQTAVTVGQMGDVVTRLATVTHAGFAEVNAKINALVDAQIRTEDNLARTEKKLVRTEKTVERTAQNVERMEHNLARTEKTVERTAQNVERMEQNLVRTEKTVERTAQNLVRTEKNVARTEKNVARTEQSLRSLIGVVDRHLREGRNGK